MSNIMPMQWAQQQLQQQQQTFTLKSPVTPTSASALGPADLDQYGGLLPHTQQQELIHQQLASRQQQQQSGGGGGFGSFFGNGSTPSPIAPAHLSNGPRSPTQIQDPNMLNGQKITSGSYVYTNGIAATASTGQPLYASTNGYHGNGAASEAPPSSTTSASSSHTTLVNQHGTGGPQSPTTPHPPPSLHMPSRSTSGVSTTPHTTNEKLKRTQSTPRITAKSFGASGGKSFMASFGRGGNGS